MAVTAGATFTFIPTWVFPEEPQFGVMITSTETMKKEYYLLSGSSSIDRYRLVFSGVSDAGYNGTGGIRTHFRAQNGGYQSFKWATIPSYILSSSVTGRWVAGSLKETPNANYWDLELTFEHDKSLD